MSKEKNPNVELLDIVKMLESGEKGSQKNDDSFFDYSILTLKNRPFRGVCQFIFLGVLRRKLFFEKAISEFSKRGVPRRKVMRCALAACAELFEAQDEEKRAKCVHAWVEFAKGYCSVGEANFLNAFLRHFPNYCEEKKSELDEAYAELLTEKSDAKEKFVERAASYYSYPKILVEKWISEFGAEKTFEILMTNSLPSGVFFRFSPTPEAVDILKKNSELFEPTEFENFWILKHGKWEEAKAILNTKYVYIQDPSTSFAPKELNPKAGESVLDLCAAPGGKSRMLADLMLSDFLKKSEDEKKALGEKAGTIVSCDFSEKRIQNLRENLKDLDFINSEILDFDLELGAEEFSKILKSKGLPEKFDKVFLDAPCSNSGVLRRRPDARYRLSEKDFTSRPALQKKLVLLASKFVKSGGKLAYSTCSIEKEENSDVVQDFLNDNKDFSLTSQKIVLPSNHNDGAGFSILSKF